MNPHILFICNEYPPAPGGGIGTFYQTLARALAKKGWKVTVCGLYNDLTKPTSDPDHDVTVWRLPALKQRKFMYRINMFVDRLRLGKWVRNYCQKTDVSLIETADYQGWLWGVYSTVPTVVRLHGADTVFFPLLGRKANKLKSYFEIASLNKADYIIGTSKFITEQTMLYLANRNKKNIIIYNMVDIDIFCPDARISRCTNTVASVSALTRKKGVYQILEAWRTVIKIVPHACLIYYGRDIPDEQDSVSNLTKLKSLAKSYNIEESIVFAGNVPYSDLVDVFRKTGVVIFPSYIEAHPRAWLEAMATGTPVIGSPRGPGTEVIEDGVTGILVDPDDIDLLAAKIIYLLNNPEYAHEFGVNSREFMKNNFSEENILTKNTEFYLSCIQTSA